MRYTELIFFSIILSFLSVIISASLLHISRLDKKLVEIRRKTDSLIFISESFSRVCEDEISGAQAFDKWKHMCKELWNLEEIEWEIFEASENPIYYGRWTGTYGNGEVYGKKAVKENESKN